MEHRMSRKERDRLKGIEPLAAETSCCATSIGAPVRGRLTPGGKGTLCPRRLPDTPSVRLNASCTLHRYPSMTA